MHADAHAIERTFDLLPLVESDSQVKRQGAYYIGPCPFCGGTDRFNLKQTENGWRWFCRYCGEGKYHGAIDYIMRRENLSFTEAVNKIAPGAAPSYPWLERARRAVEAKQEMAKPGQRWQERGKEYVKECMANLWKPENRRALDWLTARGFIPETLQRYGIGYNPNDRNEPLATWGMTGDGEVWLARGIVIPCASDSGELYYVKTRRPIQAGSKEKKYIKVKGSKPGLFGHWNLRGAWLAIVTEGEFDCMILDQQAKDLAGVGTFGSATDSPMNVDPDLLRWHTTAAYTCLVFDNDEQGQDGARRFQEHLPRVKIMNLPDGYKDLNEAHLAGLDLAGWLCRETERLGIVEEETEMEPCEPQPA